MYPVLTPVTLKTFAVWLPPLPTEIALGKVAYCWEMNTSQTLLAVLLVGFAIIDLFEIFICYCTLDLLLLLIVPSPSPFGLLLVHRLLIETKNSKHCSNSEIGTIIVLILQMWKNNLPKVTLLITGCLAPKPVLLTTIPYYPKSWCSPGFWAWARI